MKEEDEKGEEAMNKTIKTRIGAAAAALLFLAVLPTSGMALDVSFKGKVTYLDKENLSLEKKFELAYKEFKRGKKNDAYFTGYIFLCRHGIQFGDEGTSEEPYKLYVKEGKIKACPEYRVFKAPARKRKSRLCKRTEGTRGIKKERRRLKGEAGQERRVGF